MTRLHASSYIVVSPSLLFWQIICLNVNLHNHVCHCQGCMLESFFFSALDLGHFEHYMYFLCISSWHTQLWGGMSLLVYARTSVDLHIMSTAGSFRLQRRRSNGIFGVTAMVNHRCALTYWVAGDKYLFWADSAVQGIYRHWGHLPAMRETTYPLSDRCLPQYPIPICIFYSISPPSTFIHDLLEEKVPNLRFLD